MFFNLVGRLGCLCCGLGDRRGIQLVGLYRLGFKRLGLKLTLKRLGCNQSIQIGIELADALDQAAPGAPAQLKLFRQCDLGGGGALSFRLQPGELILQITQFAAACLELRLQVRLGGQG